MKENAVKDKSFAFAIRIVKLYQLLCADKKEVVISRQLLRSGDDGETRESIEEHKFTCFLSQKRCPQCRRFCGCHSDNS